MTWKFDVRCLPQHQLRKNYDLVTDTYKTTMAEMGGGCESCHGLYPATSLQSHHPGEKGDPTLKAPESRPNARYLWLLSCPPGELTGDFNPGDDFSII